MRQSTFRSVAQWLIAFLFAAPAAAQTTPVLRCVTPVMPTNSLAQCSLKGPAEPSQRLVEVQLVGTPVDSGQVVTFTVETPGWSNTGKDTTDADGKASFAWFGAAGPGVKVTATVEVDGREITRVIEVQASTTSTQRSVALISDPVVFGYEKRQLKEPVTVRIRNTVESCDSTIVVFRPYGTVGAGSPDSVRATSAPDSDGCTASTWWRLGEGVGRQHLRAFLVDEPAKAHVLHAVARATPRLNAGIVSTYDFRHYDRAEKAERTLHVTRRIVDPVTGDTVTVVTDSTAKTISVTEVDGEWFTKPVVSVDFPILARWTRLRASLGAAFESADTDWYIGVSAIQPFRGVSQEAVGADFHAVFHFGRRDVLADPACDDDGNTTDCKVEKEFLLPLGIGMMATFDATSLLSALGSIFP